MQLPLSDLLGLVSLILAIVALIVTVIGFFASLKFYKNGIDLQDRATKALAKIEEKTTTLGKTVNGMFDKTLEAAIQRSAKVDENIEAINGQIEKFTQEIFEKKIIELSSISESEKNKLTEFVKNQFDTISAQVITTQENAEEIASGLKTIEDNNIGDSTMLAFTTNETLEINLKYGIYYDPADRNHNSPFKYIGLYAYKAIQAVGVKKKVVYCDYDNGKLVSSDIENSLGQLTSDEYNRVKGMIEDDGYTGGYSGMKYFIVDEYFDTHFIKVSFSSIRGKKYFYLNEIDGFMEGMSAETVAQLLDGKTWK